jgi:hypothetical protein
MKMDLFRKYLLMSAAAFAPPGEGGTEGEVDGGQEGESQDENGEVAAGEDEGQGDEGNGEGADEEGDEGQVDEQPVRKPSRAQSRIQTLTRTLAEEKTERQRIDRELADLRADQRARQQATQQETPEAKATRRALMDPLEVMREDLNEAKAHMQGQLHQQALVTQESNDKLLYNSILKDAPHLKKYDSEVERIRLEQQSQGRFVPREVLLDLAIGRAARAAAVKAGAKPKQQGQARIAAQQSRPAPARGDTGSQRGKQGDSAEKRLLNVPI